MKKTVISIIVSFGILSIIYSQLDIAAILSKIQSVNLFLILLGMLISVPATLLTAWRFTWLVPRDHSIGFWKSNKLILAAGTMNLILPSRMGDLVKGIFITKEGGLSHSQSFSLVLLEKSCDLFSIFFWAMCGTLYVDSGNWIYSLMRLVVCTGLVAIILLYFSTTFSSGFFALLALVVPKSFRTGINKMKNAWLEAAIQFSGNRAKFGGILLVSNILLGMHFVLIWLFMLALNVDIDIIDAFLLIPLVILAGLLPFTFAGAGARDAGFIIVFASYFDSATGASLGSLTFLRYLLIGLAGVPFFAQSMEELRRQQFWNDKPQSIEGV